MKRLGRLKEGLGKAEDVFSTIGQIAGEAVEFKETVSQLSNEKEDLEAEITEVLTEQKEEKDTAKTQNQVSTDILEDDFSRFEEES